MRARVFVTLKPSVFDPQGKTIADALHSLGYAGVGDVRQGKYFELELAATSSEEAHTLASELVAGTGTAPQVSLGWSASTSPVQGYNVYRGTEPGQYPTKLNNALDPNTSYTDTTVSSGTTYYYAATAVNSNGQESAFSAPVEIAVP